ncbi:hypothetical protein LQ50_21285, partial [Halalkalibacter okhensis]
NLFALFLDKKGCFFAFLGGLAMQCAEPLLCFKPIGVLFSYWRATCGAIANLFALFWIRKAAFCLLGDWRCNVRSRCLGFKPKGVLFSFGRAACGAIANLFALFWIRKAAFCLLDER